MAKLHGHDNMKGGSSLSWHPHCAHSAISPVACREKEANSRILSMLCHLLFGCNAKMSGYHFPSRSRDLCQQWFCGNLGILFSPPAPFLKLHASPLISISSIYVTMSYCFSFPVSLSWIMVGGSLLDRLKPLLIFLCIDFLYYSYQSN
jgi:hypothetical protein